MGKLKYNHEVKLVKVSEIKANEYNPNVVEDPIMKQLEKRIEEEGFLQPVLLRHIKPKGDVKYEIIDGEHRWIAATNKGYDEIPAIILDKKLPEAMIGTINMNKLRGQFDTLKLAEVIHTLHETYSIEELEEKLGYNREEIEGLENLLGYDFDALDDEGVPPETPTEDVEFKVMLTAKQNEILQKAIEETGKEEVPDALVDISISYLKKNAQE